ncbi:MAG: DUF1735 domain-containing protein [Sediminibacterium sp.]
MKLYRKILAAGALAIGFSGCLKDDSAVMSASNTTNVVEFKNTAPLLTTSVTSQYGALALNVIMQANGTYNAMVSYSGPNVAPEDITINIAAAPASVITTYNTENKLTGTAAYTPLPSTNYTLPKTTVVIPKGERTALVPMTFINSDQIFGKGYALALAITSVSGGHTISGNFGTIIYFLSGINSMDGVYELHFKFEFRAPGTTTPAANDRGYDVFPVSWYYSDIQMVTASTTNSTMRNLNAGTSITTAVHAATAGGLPSNIATTIPLLTYNLTTNKVTAVANNTATSPRTLAINTAADNRFDPATGNIYVSFTVKEAAKNDMLVYDTLFYKTPRP